MIKRIAAVLLVLSACAAGADKKATPPKAEEMQFESYQLVLLKKGPKWSAEKNEAAEKRQAAHIAHLTKMGESGKMVIAGPFSDQKDESLRGLCLYRVGSLDEARSLAEQDPAVQSGHLVVEVLTWWVEKGYVTFPKAPPAK